MSEHNDMVNEILELRTQLAAATQRAERAEAACAEMRDVLEKLPRLYSDASDNECTCYSYPDSGCRYCRKWEKADSLAASILSSPDCGQGYVKDGVSKEDLGPTVELLQCELVAVRAMGQEIAEIKFQREISRLQKLMEGK